MKGFEKIKRQIEEINSETDSRKVDLEKQIASVKAEIEQADNAMKIAADTKSVDDFQKQQAVLPCWYYSLKSCKPNMKISNGIHR